MRNLWGGAARHSTRPHAPRAGHQAPTPTAPPQPASTAPCNVRRIKATQQPSHATRCVGLDGPRACVTCRAPALVARRSSCETVCRCGARPPPQELRAVTHPIVIIPRSSSNRAATLLHRGPARRSCHAMATAEGPEPGQEAEAEDLAAPCFAAAIENRAKEVGIAVLDLVRHGRRAERARGRAPACARGGAARGPRTAFIPPAACRTCCPTPPRAR